MTIRYLSELLTVKCENVMDTIAEMRRVGALDDQGDAMIAEKTRLAVQYCAEHFRVVPKDEREDMTATRERTT